MDTQQGTDDIQYSSVNIKNKQHIEVQRILELIYYHILQYQAQEGQLIVCQRVASYVCTQLHSAVFSGRRMDLVFPTTDLFVCLGFFAGDLVGWFVCFVDYIFQEKDYKNNDEEKPSLLLSSTKDVNNQESRGMRKKNCTRFIQESHEIWSLAQAINKNHSGTFREKQQ